MDSGCLFGACIAQAIAKQNVIDSITIFLAVLFFSAFIVFRKQGVKP